MFSLKNFLSFRILRRTFSDSPGALEISSRRHISDVSIPPLTIFCLITSPSSVVSFDITRSPISSDSLVSLCS